MRQRGPSMRISYVPLVVGVLVAVSALSYAIYRRATGPLSASVLGSPTAPPPRPVTAPPLKATPLPWTVESSPETVDVFLPDGTMVGRTPYLADALLARGERALYLRKAGFRDEIVRYDGHEKSTVQMHPRTVQRPRPVNSKQGDDIEIHPLH